MQTACMSHRTTCTTCMLHCTACMSHRTTYTTCMLHCTACMPHRTPHLCTARTARLPPVYSQVFDMPQAQQQQQKHFAAASNPFGASAFGGPQPVAPPPMQAQAYGESPGTGSHLAACAHCTLPEIGVCYPERIFIIKQPSRIQGTGWCALACLPRRYALVGT